MRKVLSLLSVLALASVGWGQQSDAVQQIAQSVGVISLFWLIVASYLIAAGWVALVLILLPDWVQRKAQAVQTQSSKAFLFGLIITVVLVVIGITLASVGKKMPPVGVLSALLFLVLFTLFTLGWVPVVWVIGQRVMAVGGWERSGLVVVLVGALVLHLTAFMPIVGWAVVIYWAIVAVGLWVAPS